MQKSSRTPASLLHPETTSMLAKPPLLETRQIQSRSQRLMRKQHVAMVIVSQMKMTALKEQQFWKVRRKGHRDSQVW